MCIAAIEWREMRAVAREVPLDAGIRLADAAPSPRSFWTTIEEQQQVELALQRLTPDQRTVILLHSREHCSFVEAGRQMQRSADAARKLWAGPSNGSNRNCRRRMNDAEFGHVDDDEFAALLASYETQLAGGSARLPPTDAQLASAQPELVARFENAKQCVLLLERIWPHAEPQDEERPATVGRFRIVRESGTRRLRHRLSGRRQRAVAAGRVEAATARGDHLPGAPQSIHARGQGGRLLAPSTYRRRL